MRWLKSFVLFLVAIGLGGCGHSMAVGPVPFTDEWLLDKDLVSVNYVRDRWEKPEKLKPLLNGFATVDFMVDGVGENGGRTRNYAACTFRATPATVEKARRLYDNLTARGFRLNGEPHVMSYKMTPETKQKTDRLVSEVRKRMADRLSGFLLKSRRPSMHDAVSDTYESAGQWVLSMYFDDLSAKIFCLGDDLSSCPLMTIHLPSLGYKITVFGSAFADARILEMVKKETVELVRLDPRAAITNSGMEYTAKPDPRSPVAVSPALLTKEAFEVFYIDHMGRIPDKYDYLAYACKSAVFAGKQMDPEAKRFANNKVDEYLKHWKTVRQPSRLKNEEARSMSQSLRDFLAKNPGHSHSDELQKAIQEFELGNPSPLAAEPKESPAIYANRVLLDTGYFVLGLPVPGEYRVVHACGSVLPIDRKTVHFRDTTDVSVTLELRRGEEKFVVAEPPPGSLIKKVPIVVFGLGTRPRCYQLFVKKLGIGADDKAVTTYVAELYIDRKVLQDALGPQVNIDLTLQVRSDDIAIIENYMEKHASRMAFLKVSSAQDANPARRQASEFSGFQRLAPINGKTDSAQPSENSK